MLGRHTPPAPLERGVLRYCFLFGNERFMVWWLPLLRGDEGVCDGERRGRGWDVAISRFGRLVVARKYLSVSGGCF